METLRPRVDHMYVYDKLSHIDNSYTVLSNEMYSDGKIISHINSNGYIEVEGIDDDPNYFLYIDLGNEISLVIYKYASDDKIREAANNITLIRRNNGRCDDHTEQKPITNTHVKKSMKRPELNKLIDINNFTCYKCNNRPEFIKGKDDHIIARCVLCGIDYVLAPSRWYVVESTHTHNKITRNGHNVRDIKFSDDH